MKQKIKIIEKFFFQFYLIFLAVSKMSFKRKVENCIMNIFKNSNIIKNEETSVI